MTENKEVENLTISEENKMYACWLCCVPGIGLRTIEKLKQLCPSDKEIYESGESLWKQVLNAGQLEQIKDFQNRETPERLFEKMREKKITFFFIEEEGYPDKMRNIPDPPYGIFLRGRLPDGELPAVSVVGARDCSPYGEYVAKEIGRMLGQNGIQVISGMARGIDGISQQAAMDAGGISFGVLGSGVDVCYPASHRALYDLLWERGGILSTYAPGTPARPTNFPPRNRIVSSLADAVIVVEARRKSGTLITVDMALEQGKDVYVVPGRVTDRLSDGCNRLLKQGAGIFLSPEDFLDEFLSEKILLRKNSGKDEKKADKINRLEASCREVYEVLSLDVQSVDEILRRLKNPFQSADLTAILMRLCLENLAVQVSPGHFCLGCNLPEIDYNERRW